MLSYFLWYYLGLIKDRMAINMPNASEDEKLSRLLAIKLRQALSVSYPNDIDKGWVLLNASFTITVPIDVLNQIGDRRDWYLNEIGATLNKALPKRLGDYTLHGRYVKWEIRFQPNVEDNSIKVTSRDGGEMRPHYDGTGPGTGDGNGGAGGGNPNWYEKTYKIDIDRPVSSRTLAKLSNDNFTIFADGSHEYDITENSTTFGGPNSTGRVVKLKNDKLDGPQFTIEHSGGTFWIRSLSRQSFRVGGTVYNRDDRGEITNGQVISLLNSCVRITFSINN